MSRFRSMIIHVTHNQTMEHCQFQVKDSDFKQKKNQTCQKNFLVKKPSLVDLMSVTRQLFIRMIQ